MHRIKYAENIRYLNACCKLGLAEMNRKAVLGMTLILAFLTLAISSCRRVMGQNSSNAFPPATNNLYFFVILAGIIAAAVITVVVIIICAPPDILRSALLE